MGGFFCSTKVKFCFQPLLHDTLLRFTSPPFLRQGSIGSSLLVPHTAGLGSKPWGEVLRKSMNSDICKHMVINSKGGRLTREPVSLAWKTQNRPLKGSSYNLVLCHSFSLLQNEHWLKNFAILERLGQPLTINTKVMIKEKRHRFLMFTMAHTKLCKTVIFSLSISFELMAQCVVLRCDFNELISNCNANVL